MNNCILKGYLFRVIGVVVALNCLAVGTLHAREKIDIITLRNGDVLHGEIKSLDRGLLSVSTTFMGTVKVEWRGVARIESPQFFEVETTTGTRLFGTMPDGLEDEVIMVGAPGLAEKLERIDVIRIVPLNQVFWERLDGFVDFGYTFARANRNTQFTLSSEVKIKSDKHDFGVDYSSQLTDSKDTDRRTRNDIAVTYGRALNDRWFGIGIAQYSQNDELDLDLRQLYGGGLGRHTVQNNRTLFSWWAGAGLTRERFFSTGDPTNNVEAIGVLEHSYFIFEGNETDLNTQIAFFPNLSDFGRIRINFQTRIRWEIFKDFTWNVTFRNSFDSRPPTEGTETNDFSLTTSVGFKF